MRHGSCFALLVLQSNSFTSSHAHGFGFFGDTPTGILSLAMIPPRTGLDSNIFSVPRLARQREAGTAVPAPIKRQHQTHDLHRTRRQNAILDGGSFSRQELYRLLQLVDSPDKFAWVREARLFLRSFADRDIHNCNVYSKIVRHI